MEHQVASVTAAAQETATGPPQAAAGRIGREIEKTIVIARTVVNGNVHVNRLLVGHDLVRGRLHHVVPLGHGLSLHRKSEGCIIIFAKKKR